MRGIKSTFLTYVLSVPQLALGIPQAPGPDPPGGKKGMNSPVISTTASTKALSLTASSIILSFQTSSAIPSITFQTITELPLTTPASTSASSYTATSRAVASSKTEIPSSTLVASGQQMSSTSSMTSPDSSYSHNQRLIIILSSVLGVLGLLLIAGITILILRYRRRQAPFGRRGVSPIDDEEIASWRHSDQEKRRQDLPSEHRAAIREVPELALAHHSGWTWATTASSGSIHTIPCSFPNSPAYSPSYVAPNARAGLTDEAVPGADPFITPPKRHNSRLSKLPPNHSRSRSVRSSFSAKSMLGAQGHSRSSSELKAKDRSQAWYENYDDGSGSNEAYFKEIGEMPGPRITSFEDLNSGGLSPRPQSNARPMTWERIDDIGRAIA